MSGWSTEERWKTVLGLVTVVTDRALSVSVESLEMSCAEAVDSVAPQAGDLKADDLSLDSDVCLQEVKFIWNPVLPLYHFFWSLARLGMHQVATASPLGFEPSFAHFDRQFAAVIESLPKAFLPGLVLKSVCWSCHTAPCGPSQSPQ